MNLNQQFKNDFIEVPHNNNCKQDVNRGNFINVKSCKASRAERKPVNTSQLGMQNINKLSISLTIKDLID